MFAFDWVRQVKNLSHHLTQKLTKMSATNGFTHKKKQAIEVFEIKKNELAPRTVEGEDELKKHSRIYPATWPKEVTERLNTLQPTQQTNYVNVILIK